MEELQRQVAEFRKLMTLIPNSHTISTHQNLEAVVTECAQLIAKKKAAMLLPHLSVTVECGVN